jgi:hypothetical protein
VRHTYETDGTFKVLVAPLIGATGDPETRPGRLAAFLRFVADETVDGRSASLKEAVPRKAFRG